MKAFSTPATLISTALPLLPRLVSAQVSPTGCTVRHEVGVLDRQADLPKQPEAGPHVQPALVGYALPPILAAAVRFGVSAGSAAGSTALLRVLVERAAIRAWG